MIGLMNPGWLGGVTPSENFYAGSILEGYSYSANEILFFGFITSDTIYPTARASVFSYNPITNNLLIRKINTEGVFTRGASFYGGNIYITIGLNSSTSRLAVYNRVSNSINNIIRICYGIININASLYISKQSLSIRICLF